MQRLASQMTQDFFKLAKILSWYMKQLYVKHNNKNNLLEMLTTANKAAQ